VLKSGVYEVVGVSRNRHCNSVRIHCPIKGYIASAHGGWTEGSWCMVKLPNIFPKFSKDIVIYSN